MARFNIVNIGYRSTNFWVISTGRSRLLFDLGWPGLFGTLQANLKRMDVPLNEIRYGVASHYHIDHAGAAQDLKRAGVPLLVIDHQEAAIPIMKRWTKPQDHYTEITMDDNIVISCAESRALLATIDIPGEIVPTPGHSDDHVSLVLDDGSVFTGDLPRPEFSVMDENAVVMQASWELLREKGAKIAYPGHGPVYEVQ